MLIRQHLIDTAGMDLALARTWMQNRGGLSSYFGIVDSWLQEEQPDSAEQVLLDIPVQMTLAGKDQDEYDHFNTLKSLQIGAMRNGTSTADMVAESLPVITQVADAGLYHASAQA